MSETVNAPENSQPNKPTRDEMKAALKDETLPAIVRRNIREQLYGENSGRKALQQSLLRRQMGQLKTGQHKTEGLHKPPGMSGRQFRKARKLIQRGRKVVFGGNKTH